MSESAWPSRAGSSSFYRPELMIGAASPLWGFFTGAAAIGVAYWWSTRLIRESFVSLLQAAEPARATGARGVVRLQAVPQAAAEAVAEVIDEAVREAEAVFEAVVEPAWDATVEIAGGPVGQALIGDAVPPLPVGGEAGPISPIALDAAPPMEPIAAPVVEAVAEPVVEPAAPEPLPPEPVRAAAEEVAAPPPSTPPLRSRKPRAEGQPKPH